jgi:hypothetical protein
VSTPETRIETALVTPSTTAGQVVPRPAVTGPTRTTRACRWLGWHFGELTAVCTFGTLAATVTPWWAIGSGAVAALWGVHEVRVHRGGGDK